MNVGGWQGVRSKSREARGLLLSCSVTRLGSFLLFRFQHHATALMLAYISLVLTGQLRSDSGSIGTEETEKAHTKDAEHTEKLSLHHDKAAAETNKG